MRDVIRYLVQYNAARKAIEACFHGLPHAPAKLVNSLISRANSETGIVENITYSVLASLLTIDAAPGRKDSGTPQKQTIRSYLRTIEAQCGDYFQIISDSQTLKLKFPTLPAIYASHFESMEVYTDQNTVPYIATPLVNTEENTGIAEELNTEEYTEPYTDEYTPESFDAINVHEHTCAKIKPNFKPNNNNKTLVGELSSGFKTTIADDFRPSQRLVDKALSLGLSKVRDESEINKFILYNQSSGSRWANFDYVYLTWLQRDAEREQAMKALEQQPKPERVHQRSDCNEQRNSYVVKSGKPTVEDAMRANSDAIAPWECTQPITFSNIIDAEYFMALDSNGGDLRPDLCYQTRCP